MTGLRCLTISAAEIWQLWLATVLLAGVSALVTLAVGLPTGYWLASLGGPARRLVQTTMVVPFLLPPFLIGGFFVALLGRATLIDQPWLWLVLGHALMNIGFLAAVTASGLQAIDRELIETGRSAGANSWQLARLIELPMIRRGLATATLLVAIYSSTSYGLVAMLGGGRVLTLEVAVSQAALQRLDLTEAAWLAAAQLLLALLMVAVTLRLSQGEATPLFGATEGRPHRAGWFSAGIGLGALTLVVAMLGTLLAGAFLTGGSWLAGGDWTLANFANLNGRGARDILNLSLTEALGNSLRNLALALSLALPVAWLIAKPGSQLKLFSVLPLGLSPVVLGLAGLAALGQLSRIGLPFAWQWLVLPVFQALLVLPVLVQLLAPARASLEASPLEAAALDGADRWQILRHITAPLLQRPISIAIAIGGLAVLGEFGTASFMSFGSQATLSVALSRLLSQPGAENLGMFSAAAAIFVVLAWCLLWLVSAIEPAAQTERRVS